MTAARGLLRFLGPLARRRPEERAADPLQARVCCLVHVYYGELWDELGGYIRNFGGIPVDLHVNVVRQPGSDDIAARVRAEFPAARVTISANRGRDIGGFFALMRGLDFGRYDLVCLVHTKKSPHMLSALGRRWRRGLLDALLGSPRRAAGNVAAMLADRSIGAIAARRYRRTNFSGNRETYLRLLDRIGIAGYRDRCEFVGGTMMLVRPRVLQRIYEALHDIEFEDGDSLVLRDHVDGQVAHAIERLIGTVMLADGLRFWWRR